MNIQDLEGTKYDLIVEALHTLYRKRINSYYLAYAACSLAGMNLPSKEIFEVDEINQLLQLMRDSSHYIE
ncbi:TPA: hypothetical protein ACHJX8_003677 [Yersinia enterocolitica]